MKPRYLSCLLLFILFVHHSSEQGIDLAPLVENSQNGPAYGDSNNENTSGTITGAIRNTTNSLLQRLEGPRDRIVQFIKPAVKSDFSRNVTNALHSIWNRVQDSNSTIMHNPLFRNSIVIPINTTIARLREITAPENENKESNFGVIDLNRPEDEAHLREYMGSATSHPSANPSVFFLVRDDENRTIDNQPATSETSEELAPQPINRSESHDEISNNGEIRDQPTEPSVNDVVQPSNVDTNPTKSKREARTARDSYFSIKPENAAYLFTIINRDSHTNCILNAVCHFSSRPHLFPKNSPIHRFNRMLESTLKFRNFYHKDFVRYFEAREYGLLNYDTTDSNLARECDLKFPKCEIDANEILRQYLEDIRIN